MKNFLIYNKKKLMVLMLSTIVLVSTSCSIHINNSFPRENKNENEVEEVIHSKNNNSENNAVENQNETDSTNKNDTEIKETLTDKDNEVILELINIKNKLSEILKSDEVILAKDKAKGVFINMVDFIFYDGEIKGIKFDELTSEGKRKVLEIVSDIDVLIMNKYPDYKEDISSLTKHSYQKASEIIKQGIENINNFSKEKLGEENYNSIIYAKDELVYYTKEASEIIKSFSSDTWTIAKEKVKNWYEKFKID